MCRPSLTWPVPRVVTGVGERRQTGHTGDGRLTDIRNETHQPADAVLEKLNDPAVAASLVTVLDNAELLSTLVLGLSGFMERGDQIMDAVAESVNDMKAAGGPLPAGTELPKLADVVTVTQELAEAGPVLRSVLGSAMVRHETVELLGLVSEAATEGAARASATNAKISPVGAVKALRDDDVQRGLGLVIEIARALGQKLR